MSRPHKILLISDPGIPIPAIYYGGIERIIYDLARCYVSRGHEVVILATDGSVCNGAKIYSIGKNGFPPTKNTLRLSVLKTWFFVGMLKKFDIVINFGRALNLIPFLYSRQIKVQCYQRVITASNVSLIKFLKPVNYFFVSCSNKLALISNCEGFFSTIYNCVVFDDFDFNLRSDVDSYLMFLGRLDRIKGCHTAIEVARRCNRKLIIAGNISHLPDELEYYKQEILPFIDGDKISYVGPVGNEDKIRLLKGALALLMPIEWEEPFGIVMIESMACGTPVIAFERGSVSEVVQEGVTGFIVHDVEEMVIAVNNIQMIDRLNCRKFAESRFDVVKIAEKYLEFLK